MEKKYFTIRVSKKVKDVYKEIKYNKSQLIEKFREKYRDKYPVFVSDFKKIHKFPPAILGGKETITAPVNVKDKREFEAFIGYILDALRQTGGDKDKTIEYIRKDLEVE